MTLKKIKIVSVSSEEKSDSDKPTCNLCGFQTVQRNKLVQHKQRVHNKHEPTKILLVGDSIAHNLEFHKIEKAANVRIKRVKAYSSVYNKSARWPKLNVADVTKNALADTTVDLLVLSAPSVDITNLDTSHLSPMDDINMELYREKVINSCRNMFTTATSSLKSNTQLNKVLLLTHIPRFDKEESDPAGIKQTLARLANSTLQLLVQESALNNRVSVGIHQLECSEDTYMDRYRDTRTGRYDGVHMYGQSGRKAYTESVLSIIREAVSEPSNSNDPC